MQNFQLGDYRGGRDTLNEAMQMQYAPLQNLAQAANTFGAQGMAGANKLKSQAMEQGFLRDMNNVKFGQEMEMNKVKFGQEMDKLGSEYDRRLQEQAAGYGFQEQIHHQDQIDQYNRESETDKRKIDEAERLRLLKEGQDVEAMQGQTDYLLGLYGELAQGYDPNSKEGKLYSSHLKTLSDTLNKGSPYQKAGALKALMLNHGNDPTITSAYLGQILTANDQAARKQSMQNQQEVPETDAYGLGGTDKDFHWTKPKSTTPTKK